MRKIAIAAAIAIGTLSPAVVTAQNSVAATERPFLLFFDWGKPDVTRNAAAVLDQAASTHRQTPGIRLRIAGHADRSGSASYNLRASRRRAEAVRSELVGRGVPASATTVVAYGEERPIVTTQDGVREVQNRRVEISVVIGQ